MKANHHMYCINVRQKYFVLLFCFYFTYNGFTQEKIDPMAASVAQWFTMIEQSFIALADAMPADKYDFKPTEGRFERPSDL